MQRAQNCARNRSAHVCGVGHALVGTGSLLTGAPHHILLAQLPAAPPMQAQAHVARQLDKVAALKERAAAELAGAEVLSLRFLNKCHLRRQLSLVMCVCKYVLQSPIQLLRCML